MAKWKRYFASDIPERVQRVVQWAESPRFESTVNGLLRDAGAVLREPDHRCPNGRHRPNGTTALELEEYLAKFPTADRYRIHRDWWMPYPSEQSRRPVWDLLCHIDVDGQPGLLLGHSLAFADELQQPDQKERPDPTMPLRLANDFSIRLRLSETGRQLAQLGWGSFQLSADHHYSLASRIAYLHKVASEGVPVVLMVLGWLNAAGENGRAFASADQFQRLFRDYLQPVVPLRFLEQPVYPERGAAMRMIVRSLALDAVRQPADSCCKT